MHFQMSPTPALCEAEKTNPPWLTNSTMMSALRVCDLANVRLLARAQTLKADSTRESTLLRGKSLVYLPMLRQDTVVPKYKSKNNSQ
ncbi:hypothetical protein VZT92_020473 [Zoarces viviparus]|uniref:Uncharacterized protein n=1 Tax=Zoarces viviparus TaxID=48416 RepID=A0AAW1EFY5_ZOAVI